jgi:hypothetical protein
MGQSNIAGQEEGAGAAAGVGLTDALEARLQAFARGVDLERLAKETGALVRHRGVATALALLRLVLGYSVLDYSLRRLGAWASLLGLAQISKTALLKRLRKCTRWLGALIVLALERQHLALPTNLPVRIKLLDATVICKPGSRGVDWRLHLGFDLASGCLDQIDLTDATGSERADRFDCQAGEIWIGDRAYALATHLAHFVFSGAWLVVRTGWNRLAWQDLAGKPFDLPAWLKQAHLAPAGPGQETDVWIPSPQGRFPLRLVAQAWPAAAAEQARRRARQAAKKNHHTVDERSVFTAGFIVLLTNLPLGTYPTQLVLALYRFRWQVELAFKRLKSLVHLDHLRARDPQLAQVYLLSKLLAVILMEHTQLQWLAQSPAVFSAQDRPLSPWRLTALLWEAFQAQVRGSFSLARLVDSFPSLLRYLCDEPRARLQQLAYARTLLARLGGCSGA